MSTPISQLPKADGRQASPSDTIDPSVTDVLEEMEKEVAAAQKPSAPQQPTSPPMYAMYQPPSPPLYMKDADASWLDVPKIKTAAVATVLAMLLLLPKVPEIYERFGRIAFLAPYELYIRAGMLALVLYLLMVRLEL